MGLLPEQVERIDSKGLAISSSVFKVTLRLLVQWLQYKCGATDIWQRNLLATALVAVEVVEGSSPIRD